LKGSPWTGCSMGRPSKVKSASFSQLTKDDWKNGAVCIVFTMFNEASSYQGLLEQ
jgi:hypothetical protein